MRAEYLVPECNLQELLARIAKLQKRAAKLGVPAITVEVKFAYVKYQVRQLTVNGTTNLVWQDSIEKKDPSTLPAGAFLANAWEPTGLVMAWNRVTVNGQSPSFEGWRFVAVLEPMTTDTGEALNMMQTLPGEHCPAEYREVVGRCDHCKAKRRRNQTFVVSRGENDECGFPLECEYKCVGRQCIKDFLGYHADPHKLAAWAEMLAELSGMCGEAGDEDWLGNGGGSRGERAWDLKFFLTLTASRVKKFGWVSRTTAREYGEKEATADKILWLLTPPNQYWTKEDVRKWENENDAHAPDDDNRQTAEAAIEWAKAFTPEEIEQNNYYANCNLVARVGCATRKTAGIAASIIIGYYKSVEREIERREKAAKPESKHVGTIGKRMEMTLTCEGIINKESEQFGVTAIHKMHDADGNDVTWFASEGTNHMEEGHTYRTKATVKSHGEFRGRKQTVVTRVTLIEDVNVTKIKLVEDFKDIPAGTILDVVPIGQRRSKGIEATYNGDNVRVDKAEYFEVS